MLPDSRPVWDAQMETEPPASNVPAARVQWDGDEPPACPGRYVCCVQGTFSLLAVASGSGSQPGTMNSGQAIGEVGEAAVSEFDDRQPGLVAFAILDDGKGLGLARWDPNPAE